jgi:hypothetical protein
MTRTVNERTTAYLQVAFKDKAGASSQPTSASYRLDCVTTGEQLRDWTALQPQALQEITLTPADNAIVNPGNRSETKRATVRATYGTDADQVHAAYEYAVNNLQGVE